MGGSSYIEASNNGRIINVPSLFFMNGLCMFVCVSQPEAKGRGRYHL